jgi:drug/metabolite transporter (DMT)-like permease
VPKNNHILLGHIFTFITVVIWSVAFVSNKALLEYISPIENMIMRFTLGYLLLLLLYPRFKFPYSLKDELYFALLGFLGIFIYFLLENFALTYTQATNVGLYMGAIPIMTALFAHFLTKDEGLSIYLLQGFAVAILGIGLILLEGIDFELRLYGDLLALGAAAVFALYSVILRLAPKGYHYIVITRKSFFYGLCMMVLYHLFTGGEINLEALTIPAVWGNILFLGLLSSGLAFILWHQGIERIGSISASNYIYLVPLVTAITGIFILDEKITVRMVLGGVLILLGLFLAQRKKAIN